MATEHGADEAFEPTGVPPLESEPVDDSPPEHVREPLPASHNDVLPDPADLEHFEEVEAERTAMSRVFRNEEGLLVLQEFAVPIHHRVGESWEPISNAIVPDRGRPGWVRTEGNEWSVAFGPLAEGIELRAGGGSISVMPLSPATESGGDAGRPGRWPGEGPGARRWDRPASRDAPEVAPRRERAPARGNARLREDPVDDPATVTYRRLRDGVDLRYTVTSLGVKEDIVLATAEAGSVFGFEFSGTSLSPGPGGGLTMSGPVGEQFRIPAPTVVTGDGSDATHQSGVRYELVSDTLLEVSVDPEWLGSLPEDRFPVEIDPSWIFESPTNQVVVASPTATPPAWDVRMGRDSWGRIWRSAVAYNQYAPYIGQDLQVYTAAIVFSMQSSTTLTRRVDVFDHGATRPGTWSAIGTGKHITTLQINRSDFRTGAVDVTEIMQRAFETGAPAQWFGARGQETGTTVTDYSPWLELYLWEPPDPSFVNNVANHQVFATTTPTLHAQPVPSPSGSLVTYEFQITTSPSPGSGLTVSSGPGSPTSWTVPQGALSEGVTYYAWVLTNYSLGAWKAQPTVPPQSAGRTFTVDLGLGEGGPSPTDEVGSVPGEAQLPAEAAPGPSLPGSKVTVNLVDGNLSLAVGTTTMGTLEGGIALGFRYNSLAVSDRGLRAEYFNDVNGNGEIDSNDVKIAERVDPTVNFDWGTPALTVAAQDPAAALARWTGYLTYPFNATLRLGAISSDGMRIRVGDTLRLDQWAPHPPQSFPEFGSSFSVQAGVPVPIQVEWRNTSGRGVARVFVRDVDVAQTYPLDASWLSQAPRVLPHGWTFNADAGTLRWVGLKDLGTSVSVFDTDGTAHEFIAADDGSYTSPRRAPNDLLTIGDAGRFVLRDAAGVTYTFRPEGVLESVMSATDDRNPAAHTYEYSGSPLRLRTITDPVSERSVTLSYGGDSACSNTPTAAVGLLCEVAYWDGTASTLVYDSAGRFVRLVNPGGIVHDLAYDAQGRLTDVRDPLTVDAIAAGVVTDDDAARTQIAYDSSGRVASVTQPRPGPNLPRPQRTYSYDPAARTGSVAVAGFDPSTGFAKRQRYDTRNRIVESIDPAGLSTHYTWDPLDRLVAVTDPAGLVTTTIYDHASRPIATHGPAPAAWFEPDGTPSPGRAVPTTTREFDGGIHGLAAAYWDNPHLAGGPVLHDTGLAANGSLTKDWGTAPPVTPGPGGWSARYTGHLHVSAAGAYQFQIRTQGSFAAVWINEQQVVRFDGPEPDTGLATVAGPTLPLEAGPHRIRVDMVDTSGEARLVVRWRPAGETYSSIGGSVLDPNYGLETRTTDPDGIVTATEYADQASGIGPHHGLETATVADPGGLELRTELAYESPGAGSFLRRTERRLPAGNAWSTVNYEGTEGPIEPVCSVDESTPQGGFPKRVVGPAPDGPGSARVHEFVYDVVGRPVGERIADAATISTAGWRCVTYDDRGRVTSRTWPADDAAGERTVTHEYAVGGNPLVNSVSEPGAGTGEIMATADLLARTVRYVDVWGQVTETVFDQAGRVVSTEDAWLHENSYDPDTGRLSGVSMDSTLFAGPLYDEETGRLQAVFMRNGTVTVPTYDDWGREDGAIITTDQGWTGEIVSRSPAGRVVDQEVFVPGEGFVDANPSGANYTYDAAGRLVNAHLPDAVYDYGYGPAPDCGHPDAGLNTNRTSATISGQDSVESCYNAADQLVSTSDIPASEISYDARGNTLRLGSEQYEWDSADRLVRAITPGNVTKYERDALDRVVQRSDAHRIEHVDSTSAGSPSASVSTARPAGTEAGDAIIASVTSKGLAGPPSGLSAAGWTVLASQANLLGRTWVLHRTATAADPTSWSFNATGATDIAVVLSTYRDVASDEPLLASAADAALLATSHPVPQVTTTLDASRLLHVVGYEAETSPATPAGTELRGRVAGGASILVLDREQTTEGTPPAIAVTTDLPQNSSSITVALTPQHSRTRYLHVGHNDNSRYAIDAETGGLRSFNLPLVGGSQIVFGPHGFAYAHTNLSGHVVTVTAPGSRTLVWAGHQGPYGEEASSGDPPTSFPDGTSWAWHGDAQRLTDRHIIHMGARIYNPAHGRFLSVDPIEGGCANDYMYTFGDPIIQQDVSGMFCVLGKNPDGSCRNPIRGAARGAQKLFAAGKKAFVCAGKVVGSFLTPPAMEGHAVSMLGASVGTAGQLTAAFGVAGVVVPAGSAVLVLAGGALMVVGAGLIITGIILVVREVC